MKTGWTIPTIITLIIASYGAILATFEYKKNQRHLSVILEEGPPEGGSLPFIKITIRNTGIINVTVNSVYIKLPELPDDYKIPIDSINFMLRPSAYFPYELTAGKDCLLGIDIDDFIEILKNSGHYGEVKHGKVKLVALVIDGTGKVYKSRKSLVFNLEKYDKQNES